MIQLSSACSHLPRSARGFLRSIWNHDFAAAGLSVRSFASSSSSASAQTGVYVPAISTKIMEFMALAVPVLVSGTAVDRYYFNDSIVRFFSPGDEEDLARQMLVLIRDPGMRQDLSGSASAYVEHNNWDSMKETYFAIVDSLVPDGAGGLVVHHRNGIGRHATGIVICHGCDRRRA